MGKLIAIVDDDPDTVAMLEDLLQAEGYRTVSSLDHGMAVELVRVHQPTLLILDLMAGRLYSGWGVLTSLREDHTSPAVPVILVSAAARFIQTNQDLLRAHVYETIPKPFPAQRLLDTIYACIGAPTTGDG